MGIRKQFLKSKPICKVTFSIPLEIAKDAQTVFLVGDFNDWSPTATPMKKMKNDGFSVTLDLEPGRIYQFRYLLDESRWENDPDADGYCPTVYEDANNGMLYL
ncbi:isoamylase early set domain-containing protein [Desulfosarcina sp. OttesenSCG-928-A07]|nr:isoamylase early set domain-containing protein [Desulfosarcina sp. OttesenSCG-928-G17]MDL2328942.1 isoamylase early set domain-containing protein [Desulfosarcina sp. OttesenSCG-928-A07]